MSESKRILDVGQCRPDHFAIRLFIESLGFQVEQAHLLDDAMQRLQSEHFDLVLVNRKLDHDYSDGVDLVRAMKENPATREIPVMVISNYPEAQDEAVRSGAVRGFGKLELHQAKTGEYVKAVVESRLAQA